ncbi:hypothetical protein [Sphingobium lactosutens]|uniref:Energy transducer TonB n=1 Tax=Sphingobium lactosutens DS20 TaxID=1331060 RepID=T0J3M7_9SPHN|nr:hypothetical protein [Sphingobium lactosutens]EQB16579.1 hypothetical protein RLDS_07115 [Sphingobium lactosutens DS20]
MNISSIPWDKVRQRAGGVTFALVLNLLLLLALFTLSPSFQPPKMDPRLPVTFETEAGPKAAKEEAKAEKAERKEKSRAEPQKAEEPVVRPPVEVEKPAEQPPSPFPFLTLNREQMASADIGTMPKRAPGEGAAGQGESAAVAGPGEGPGGVQLRKAQWYRRPKYSELLPYLPENRPKSWWVLMACEPVDHYHVENCQVLKESSPQFGLGRAMRLAAWQFLIIPERVNGKVMAGSMVSILIDHRAAAPLEVQ